MYNNRPLGKLLVGLDDTGNGEGSENGGVGAVDFEAAGSDSDEFIPDGLEEPDDFEMDPEEEEPRAKKALPGKSSVSNTALDPSGKWIDNSYHRR